MHVSGKHMLMYDVLLGMVDRDSDLVNQIKRGGWKQCLSPVLLGSKTTFLLAIPLWSLCFGIRLWTAGCKKFKTHQGWTFPHSRQ